MISYLKQCLSLFGNHKKRLELEKLTKEMTNLEEELPILFQKQQYFSQQLEDLLTHEKDRVHSIHSIQQCIIHINDTAEKIAQMHSSNMQQLKPIRMSILRCFQILESEEETPKMIRKVKNALSRQISQRKEDLPILKIKEEIITQLQSNQVMIVTAGKFCKTN